VHQTGNAFLEAVHLVTNLSHAIPNGVSSLLKVAFHLGQHVRHEQGDVLRHVVGDAVAVFSGSLGRVASGLGHCVRGFVLLDFV